MNTQNEIKKTLLQAKVIAHIQELLKAEHGKSRASLARYLCKEFNFSIPQVIC
jgi:transposase-like protein